MTFSGTTVLLVERQDGIGQLLTFEKHTFLPRYRLVEKYSPQVTIKEERQEHFVKTPTDVFRSFRQERS